MTWSVLADLNEIDEGIADHALFGDLVLGLVLVEVGGILRAVQGDFGGEVLGLDDDVVEFDFSFWMRNSS